MFWWLGWCIEGVWWNDKRDIVIWTTTISGYAILQLVEEAIEVFDEMSKRSLVLWTAMILAHRHAFLRPPDAPHHFLLSSTPNVMHNYPSIRNHSSMHTNFSIKYMRESSTLGIRSDLSIVVTLQPKRQINYSLHYDVPSSIQCIVLYEIFYIMYI